jgi:mannose-6-phosphate isomerase-like protein (cupin superfamily)
MPVSASAVRCASPLSTWFAGPAALRSFRRRHLGRQPLVLAPRDGAWRSIAPHLAEWPAIARTGLPFQIVADRRYDRSGDPRRLSPALADGKTVFFPQIHQVLPRLMRLMVTLRAEILGPGRDERSFLFLADGRGREGMGLHHDGEVDAFWIQLEGRRTITIGPPVSRRARQDLRASAIDERPGFWSTFELQPGTLFYMPARTPHRVVYYEQSAALSLTWGPPPVEPDERAFAAWDVVAGRANRVPAPSRGRLWTQVPAVAGRVDRGRREFPLWLPGDAEIRLPATLRPIAASLVAMPSWQVPPGSRSGGLVALVEHGLVGPRELPLWIIPADPNALDGWRFA